ncbi:hypothetical protein KSS87_012404 [Heliosperma pusillum]|nr:hypothetical protein KSS87_012404 [Heliosperma pusillum]
MKQYKEDSLFTEVVTIKIIGNKGRLAQGVTMQTMGNEARKTHCL